MMQSITKTHNLSDPVATTGDRIYVISTQNGLFPDFTSLDHSTHEMWGVWDHPLKLLDGYWFGLRSRKSGSSTWLSEAAACSVTPITTTFHYRVGPWQVNRCDFVPDGVEGLTVTLSVHAAERWMHDIELVALFRSDLQPAWLGEQVGMIDQPDRADLLPDGRTLLFQDEGNPWFVAVTTGGEICAIDTAYDLPAPQQTLGQGTSGRFTMSLHFDSEGNSQCTFFIAGSMHSAEEALATLAKLQNDHATLQADKAAAYQAIANHSSFHSPDEEINDAFEWSKINFQRHLRTVPGMGSGVGAGLPSYPWWFGIDSEYAIPAMLQAGLFEISKETLRLLRQESEKHNIDAPGLIVHELVTNGVVFNSGNIVEVPAFVRAVADVWRWTGDRLFLAEMYPFCKMALLDHALGICDPDGDLCPLGRSIIETLEMHAGFECIDVAAYTWDALRGLAELATAVGDTALLPDLLHKADKLAQCIRSEWWLEDEGLFADLRATLEKVQSALAQLEEKGKTIDDEGYHRQVNDAKRWFAPQLQTPRTEFQAGDRHWLLRHWVVMTPAEVGLASVEQAQRLFDRLESPEFIGEWGMYLHPERHDAMSINSGLLALSEGRYGRIAQAHRLVALLASQLNLRTPGSISEALPDQWCFLQLWSGVGIISPVVETFLGIVPNAAERTLRIVPNLPIGWDEVTLRRLRVGQSHFEIRIERQQQAIYVRVLTSGEPYHLQIGSYLADTHAVVAVTVNGKAAAWQRQKTISGDCIVTVTEGDADVHIEMN